MQEIWKDIQGYEGQYQVSNTGKVKSLNRCIEYLNRYGNKSYRRLKEKELILSKDLNGYLHIMLHKNKTAKVFRIHQLVAQAFMKNPNNLPQINHIDGNKENNNVTNLEYCTISENHLHAYRTGLHNPCAKRCVQKDLNGNIIRVWDSLKEITDEIGYDASAISRCCKHKQNTSNDDYVET